MSTTGQDLFDRAIQRSSLNAAAHVSPTQVLAWIAAEQRKLFLDAARLNPSYFGKTDETDTRTSATDAWDITVFPGDVAAITAIRADTIVGTVTGLTAGDTLFFVDKRFANLSPAPRVYLRGRKLYGYGTELGTGANYVSVLELDYAELPAAPIALTTALRLPDEWTILPELKLAKIFALQDQRREDIEILEMEYQMNYSSFQAHVLMLDHGAVRPLQAIPALPIMQGQAQE